MTSKEEIEKFSILNIVINERLKPILDIIREESTSYDFDDKMRIIRRYLDDNKVYILNEIDERLNETVDNILKSRFLNMDVLILRKSEMDMFMLYKRLEELKTKSNNRIMYFENTNEDKIYIYSYKDKIRDHIDVKSYSIREAINM